MDSLHKSHCSNKNLSSWNSSEGDREDQRPILYGNRHENSGHHQEAIVKIDEGNQDIHMKTRIRIPVVGSKVWKESSNEFQKEVNPNNGSNGVGGRGGEDSGFSFQSQSPQEINQNPPSQPTRLFMKKQKKSGAEMALDMDLEMEGLKKPMEDVIQSKELRVAYQEDPNKAPSPLSQTESEEDDSDSYDERRELWRGSVTAIPVVRDASAKVLRCSSNSLFCRRSNMLLRAKTRSRLIDSPTANGGGDDERKSLCMSNRFDQLPPWSSQFPLRSSPPKSRPLSKSSMIEDPLEDLPDEFNHTKMSKWTTLQLIGFIQLIVALIGSLTIHKIQHQTIWGLHLWKLLVLVLVLKYGFLLSCRLTCIIDLFLERNFKLYKRLLYFVHDVRNDVKNCIWLSLVLIAWQSLFDKKIQRENKTLSYITRILFCSIFATVLRLVKTLMLKVLAFSFHVSTYFDRIREAFFKQYVIQTLSGPSLIEIQHKMEEDDQMIAEVQKIQNAGATIPNNLRATAIPSRTRRVIFGSGDIYSGSTELKCSQIKKSIKLSGDLLRTEFGRQQLQHEDGITIDQLHKLNQKNISAWNMKRLMRIVRHGTLTILYEQITRESEEDESTLHIRSEYEANIAAIKIFNNVAKQGAKHIYLVDVMRFMREDEALRTMTLFNGARDYNRVSRRALKNWVVNAFRDRKALSLTLNDTKAAMNKLHQMANIIVFIILIALWLLILNIATTHFLLLLSSQVLLLVFIFGNTLKTTFEAIIFLFVMHPFDVGDRCEVDGVEMIVEKMNILTTVFLRYDNLKITYPNNVLAQLPISNYYRSPDMEKIALCGKELQHK